MGVYIVAPDVEAGKRLIERLETAGMQIGAALWFYFSEPAEWRLVIATPLVDREGPSRAYAEVQRVMKKHGAEVDLRRISLMSPKEPLIESLRSALPLPPPPSGVRLHNSVINNVYIEDAIIYRLQ